MTAAPTPTPDAIHLMTVKDVASFLKCGVRSARSMVGSFIPAVKLGPGGAGSERRHWRAGRVQNRWATVEELRGACGSGENNGEA